ncbi:Nucleotidyl transferase [Penicillium majusculum]|nr:Nucleotidyl transferase [Penicillium majusculum]
MFTPFRSSESVNHLLCNVVSNFWAPDVGKVLAAKLRDKEEYEKSLCQRFEDAAISDEGEDSEH